MDTEDYTDEIQYDEFLRNEASKILIEYRTYLEEKGHTRSYIQDQLDYISYFAVNYLIHYNRQCILEFDDYSIEDFLGLWCPRKVLFFKKADILLYLRALKKFSGFLLHDNKISEERHADITERCNNPREFIEKFERYEDLNPDSGTWEEDYEAWMYNQDIMKTTDLKGEMMTLLHKDKTIINKIFEKHHPDSIPIVEDFKRFGSYLIKFKKGIGLTNNLFCLKRADILKINSILSFREDLAKNINQKDTVLIHFFFLASKRLGLFKYTKKMKFKSTSLIHDFLNLSSGEQYWLLFRALWDKINWYRLYGYSKSGRPEQVHIRRFVYIPFFSNIDTNRWFTYRELWKSFKEYFEKEYGYNSMMSHVIYLYGVFTERILPLLAYFGIFEINYEIPAKESHLEEMALKMMPLGNTLFSLMFSKNY